MTGRPSDYTEETANAFCARIAHGESVRKICDDDNMPALATVFRWLSKNQEFREQYSRAKDESAEADFDEIQDIAHKTLKGEYDPNAARVAMNGLMWTASKKKPKKYGDKLDIGNADGQPFQITVAK